MYLKIQVVQLSEHTTRGPALPCAPTLSNSTPALSSQSSLESSTLCSNTTPSFLEKCGTLPEFSSSRHTKKNWLAISGIMFCEFVGLSCLSLPGAIATLGWLGSVLTILVNWSLCTYTSHVLWKFCLKHPGEIKSVADVARKLSNSNPFVVRATIVAFLCYACSVGAIHTQISAVILNTLTDHSMCTVIFAFLGALASCGLSMSRRFSTCGTLGLFSALMMATALFLTIAFLKTGSSATSTVATHGTTVLGTTTDFVTLFNAVLAVSFSFVGQICVPSLIDEMDRPEDFGKSLWTVQLSLLAFFSAVGLTIYGLLGTGVPTPVIAALSPTFAKIVIGFTVPADICIGALFCFIAIKFLIDEVYTVQQQATRTRTVQATWIAATILFWSVSFLVAQLVPFFENLVSLMSAVFGSYFGFTLWSWTYFHAPSSHSCRLVRWALAALNIGIMLYGLLFFFAGGYSSIVAILRAYAAGSVRTAFSCANNGF